MKRIFDPQFEYRPSYATDIRGTFERARRELAASSARQGGGDQLDAGVRVAGHVHRDRLPRRLERGELALEQRRGHVAVLALCQPHGDERLRAVQEDDARIDDAGEQPLAVGRL